MTVVPAVLWTGAALSATVAVFLTACSSRGLDHLAAAGVVDGTSWRLTSMVVDGEDIALSADHPVTLVRHDGGVAGSTGCNRYRGDLTVAAGDSPLLGPLAMTRRMCVDADAMRVESLYVAALGRVCTAAAAADLVVLASAGTRLVLAPVASEATSGGTR